MFHLFLFEDQMPSHRFALGLVHVRRLFHHGPEELVGLTLIEKD